MAEVWAARVEGPQGFVKSLALKFILETFRGDPELERLFVNEARVAAQLQHANLVGVFDFDRVSDDESGGPGRYYIAMERIEGHDLRRLLQVARHNGVRLSPPIALTAASILRAAGSTMRSAASVGTMPAPERTSSGSPDSSRSRLSAADTAGWYMPSRMAARDTLRSVNTVCNTLIKWRSILSKSA